MQTELHLCDSLFLYQNELACSTASLEWSFVAGSVAALMIRCSDARLDDLQMLCSLGGRVNPVNSGRCEMRLEGLAAA